jgi:hypothetical protein
MLSCKLSPEKCLSLHIVSIGVQHDAKQTVTCTHYHLLQGTLQLNTQKSENPILVSGYLLNQLGHIVSENHGYHQKIYGLSKSCQNLW